jgi:hypothetical protein
MDDILSFGNKRNYEDFKKHIPLNTIDLFDSLRNFCLSIKDNVVEDVRMHRVVFCKSITFRWFLDAEPTMNNSIIIKIQKSRKEDINKVEIKNQQELEDIKDTIKEAFESIH